MAKTYIVREDEKSVIGVIEVVELEVIKVKVVEFEVVESRSSN